MYQRNSRQYSALVFMKWLVEEWFRVSARVRVRVRIRAIGPRNTLLFCWFVSKGIFFAWISPILALNRPINFVTDGVPY